MQAFEYAAPTSVKEALGLLSANWGETDILAGGTDLLSLMKERIETPKRVVGLKDIKELKGISKSGGGWQIGATVTLADLLGHADVKKEYPGMIQAVEGVTSQQMRAMGTVGGDLLQRPRCWYFRRGFGLLGQDGSGKSLIPNGENAYHAILGNKGPAYFVNASSLAPVLIALGAKAKIMGGSGEREVEIEKLYQIPATANDRETTLKANEILTAVVIPAAAGMVSSTYEVRQRMLMDWPLTAAAVSLKMSGGKVESARVVMGHVAPTPWRSAEAERAVQGKAVSENVAMEAGKAAVAMATPLSMNKHKVQLARVAVKRAILRAAGKEV
jgi:xanthine dehydrogenase YagS FAD-binding subunit